MKDDTCKKNDQIKKIEKKKKEEKKKLFKEITVVLVEFLLVSLLLV
jgi:hypothetical protein